MKSINEYIEGIEPGETVPSICGEITNIVPPDDIKQTQVISIQSVERIKLYIKDKALWLVNPSVGSKLSVTCGKAAAGKPVKGIVLKRNSAGKPYLVVSSGAVLSMEHPSVTEPEEPEAKTAADTIIESYTLDRLYVFKSVEKIVAEFNDGRPEHERFPVSKLPELATSVHMECSYAKQKIRPTDAQLERKKVHADRKESNKKEVKAPAEEPVKSAKPKSSIDWRKFKHPITHVPLGDVELKKVQTALGPWYYRTAPEQVKPELAEYHRNVGACLAELTNPTEILNAYIQHYAEDDEKHSVKRRTENIVKFIDGLHAAKLTKGNLADTYTVTMDEFLPIIRDFKKLWEGIVLGEDDEVKY